MDVKHTIALVDSGEAPLETYRARFDFLRDSIGAERIFVLTDGDIDRRGGLAGEDKYRRAARLRQAGADCVVQMPLLTQLVVDNLYAFAAEVMLRKLGCVYALALPFPGAEAELRRAADFLFDEPAPFRRAMRELREAGGDLEVSLPEIAGRFVPGAEALLSAHSSRMAVEYWNALKRAYSTVKPLLLPAAAPDGGSRAPSPRRDRIALDQLRAAFRERGEKQAVSWAAELFSGSTRAAAWLAECLRDDSLTSLEDLGGRAARSGMNPAAARRYAMSCLTGFRKLDASVCITYNFIPFIRVLDADAEALAALKASAGTTLIVDTAEEKDDSQATDSSKRLLLALEDRAREVFLESERAAR